MNRLYGPAWNEKLETHKMENLAQVYTCLKYSGSDFRLFSRRFQESLEEQGFGNNKEMEADAAGCEFCGKMSHCLDPDRFEKGKGE